jgi:CRP-like cAMP-binding protein
MVVEPDFWEVSWHFDGAAFEALRAECEEMNFAADAVIFKQDDPADCMYLVLDGYAVAMIVDKDSGKDRVMSIIPEGQSFGELGLLMKQRRTATVNAGTDIKVLKITQTALKNLETRQPESAMTLYKKLSRTLAEHLVAWEAAHR